MPHSAQSPATSRKVEKNAWMRHGNRSLASALSNAQYRTLEGQTHQVKGKAHVPVLVEFFKS